MYQVGIMADDGEDFVGPSFKTFTRAKETAEGYMAEPAKHDCESTTSVFIVKPDGTRLFAPFTL